MEAEPHVSHAKSLAIFITTSSFPGGTGHRSAAAPDPILFLELSKVASCPIFRRDLLICSCILTLIFVG